MSSTGPDSLALPRRQKEARLPSPGRAFLAGFLKHPAMVASVSLSSRWVIRRMLAPIDWSTARLVVEYGPGTGNVTRALLDRMPPDATLISIDTNPDFIAYLRASIDDPRLRAVCGSAADVERIVAAHGFQAVDHVISGMPFANLPDGLGDAIADATRAIIRPGGCFLVYLYSRKVSDFLAPRFRRVEHAMEWRNIPPAQLYWAWQDA